MQVSRDMSFANSSRVKRSCDREGGYRFTNGGLLSSLLSTYDTFSQQDSASPSAGTRVIPYSNYMNKIWEPCALPLQVLTSVPP